MIDKCLEKHQYPFHIKIFGLFLLLLFLYVTSVFFLFEFKQHRILKNEIDAAKYCFFKEDYYHALQLYSKLLEKYDDYELGRKRMIQSCFAYSNTLPKLYEYGISRLSKKKYSNTEIDEFAFYLPTEEQKNSFKSIFVRA